jgi:hypothetical protein
MLPHMAGFLRRETVWFTIGSMHRRVFSSWQPPNPLHLDDDE